MPAPRPLIALIGVDGAGKTTQARLLVTWLNGQGLRAAYYENGGGRPLLDRLGRLTGRRDGRGLLGRWYVPVESTFRKVGMIRALLMSRLTGRLAVLDRYTYCQYALIRARGDDGEDRVRFRYRRMPEPDVVCLLCVPAAQAQRRVRLRGRDQEEQAYLAAFQVAYRSLPEVPSFHVIDAGADPAVVQQRIRDAVAPALLRRAGTPPP